MLEAILREGHKTPQLTSATKHSVVKTGIHKRVALLNVDWMATHILYRVTLLNMGVMKRGTPLRVTLLNMEVMKRGTFHGATLLNIDVIEIGMKMTMFFYEDLKALTVVIVPSGRLAKTVVAVAITSGLPNVLALTMAVGLGVEATAELPEGTNTLFRWEGVLESKAGGCLPHKHFFSWRWMGVHMISTAVFSMVRLCYTKAVFASDEGL